jgi:hypothetical protein
MAQAWSAFVLLLFGLIVVAVFVFTAQTSKGDNALLKIGKFFGMLFSIIPIVGLIMYLVARGRPSGYGEKCGAMALIGIMWYLVRTAGARAFLQ